MRATIASNGTFKGTANGKDIAAKRNSTVQLRVYRKKMRYHTSLGFLSCFTATTKDNLLDDRAQPIVDTETSFVPCIKGEKDSILRELCYGLRKE